MTNFPRSPSIVWLVSVLLTLLLSVPYALAKSDSAYSLQVINNPHAAAIDISLDAPLDADAAPPASVNRLDVSGLDQGSLNSQNGDILHVDLGLVGTGFLKALLGDISVTVRVRKFGGGALTVEQLHADLSGRWAASDAAASKGQVPKAEIVTIGTNRYSHVEKGPDETKAFASMYSVPLTGDCYVEFLFQFTASDANTDPHAQEQAHTLINQIMQTVSIKTS